MADLTIGEIGKALQLNLQTLDQSNPPNTIPLDLTNATSVTLTYRVTTGDSKPNTSFLTRNMTIQGLATNGVVVYVFQNGDLVKPPEMSKYGVFRFAVRVVFNSGVEVVFADDDGLLTIKDDSVL